LLSQKLIALIHQHDVLLTPQQDQPDVPPISIVSLQVREWRGRMHEVIVLEDVYLWKGARYRSLSEIARLITGTRWSGPRFFGTGQHA
jgi:hypothetical protein